MRPGVIINISRFSESHPLSEPVEEARARESPMEHLAYCLSELDKELTLLSPKAPCEAILTARTELSSLKSLLSQLQTDHRNRIAELLTSENRDKTQTGSYRGVIQELMEERGKLEKEIEELERKEKEWRGKKAASPASGGGWRRELDD